MQALSPPRRACLGAAGEGEGEEVYLKLCSQGLDGLLVVLALEGQPCLHGWLC